MNLFRKILHLTYYVRYNMMSYRKICSVSYVKSDGLRIYEDNDIFRFPYLNLLLYCHYYFYIWLGNNLDIGSHRQYDRSYCSELAQHVVSSRSLPNECLKFQDIIGELKRRDSDTTHASQILS
jgi:hypothetical protein